MRYVIANIGKAKDWGFLELGHAVKGDKMCLNEKEVSNNIAMNGTLEERAETLGGWVATQGEAKLFMMNKI